MIAGNRVADVAEGIVVFEGTSTRITRNAIDTGVFGDPGESGIGIWLDGATDSLVDRNPRTGTANAR